MLRYHHMLSACQHTKLSACQHHSLTCISNSPAGVGVRERFNRTSLDGVVGRCESLWHRTCRETMSYSENCVDYKHRSSSC